jgi:hypothetical protein
MKFRRAKFYEIQSSKGQTELFVAPRPLIRETTEVGEGEET